MSTYRNTWMSRQACFAIVLGAALALFAATLLMPVRAGAATKSYTYAGTFTTGTNPRVPGDPCTVFDLAVDAEENVYALCGQNPSTNNDGFASVKKFDSDGNPIPYGHQAPYIAGNAIILNPEKTHGFEGRDAIFVDQSSGATRGYIYLKDSPFLYVFDPTGRWIGKIVVQGAFGAGPPTVMPNGNLVFENFQGKVELRNPARVLIKQINHQATNDEFNLDFSANDIAVDTTGAIWGIGNAETGFPNQTVTKYEADQYVEPEFESSLSFGNRKKASFSPYVEAPLGEFGSISPVSAVSLAVDWDDNSLFVQRATPAGILHYSAGTAPEPAHQISGVIGTAGQVGVTTNDGLAFGQENDIIYAANGNGVSKFVPGPPLPKVITNPAEVDDVGHNSAVVRGEIRLDGGGPITECVLRYGTTKAFGSTAPCMPNPADSNFTEDTEVSAEMTGLTVNSTYHYAFIAKNAHGEALSVRRSVQAAAVLGVKTLAASDIDDSSATLHGRLDPDGIPTTYYFEYGLKGEFTARTPDVTLSGAGIEFVEADVSNLRPGERYSYRLVARNALGTTKGEAVTLDVAGPPRVAGARATDVTATSATLQARINGWGYSTAYRFEYGPTPEYGFSVPTTPEELEVEDGYVSVSQELSNLQPGITYHFRIVATNQWGTAVSRNTTFYFAPQPCPNDRVRQITRSTYLPDCRAYELVSPENAGSVQIYPGNEVFTRANGADTSIITNKEIQNTGRAQSPSRMLYYGGLGTVEGIDAPNVELDSYLATRTTEGWVTTWPGFTGSEMSWKGRQTCSRGLDLCLDHVMVEPPAGQASVPNNVAYLFDASGAKAGVLPSNVGAIPGGTDFVGDWQMSPEFDRFVFSSRDVAFAPGASVGAPGAAYVNDVIDHSISVISRLPNGQSIPNSSGNPKEFITFPPDGISDDGSHILMRVRALDGPHRLFMRVDNAITYDISQGAGVRLIGMTSDGSKVLFQATQRLIPADTDDSTDIYMWSENAGNPQLAVVSQGNGEGDSDACDSAWTTGCSATIPITERGERTGLTPVEYSGVTLRGTDSRLARGNGAVYFFSPESLASGAPRNAKNLFVAREGEIQYVTTFKANEKINRIQISPDGRFAGILTAAQLTPYENEGFRQMYLYDAEQDELVCASCNPSGEPPTADVGASQNGPFMTDDGRVFFTTADRLVAGDVDAFGLPDVYEYVEGRPQLISSGLSSSGRAPGAAAYFVAEDLGLEGVSANGVDVYFSTTDTLVPQDQNGKAAKIYNARTNGGFEPEPTEAPCVAADECHGPGAGPPGPLGIGTGAVTTGGNVAPQGRKAKKGPAKRAKRKAAKRRRRAAKLRQTRRGCGKRSAAKSNASCRRQSRQRRKR